MTNCCNANGECTQGRDCPIRKQFAQETNEAFMNRNHGLEPDLIDDFAASIKGLIAVIVVVTCMTLLAFAIWGK
jgi:hypothetical protein